MGLVGGGDFPDHQDQLIDVSNFLISLKSLQCNGGSAPERDGTARVTAIFASSCT
jgi:hypothetical protein